MFIQSENEKIKKLQMEMLSRGGQKCPPFFGMRTKLFSIEKEI